MNSLEGVNKWSLISGGTPRFMRGYEMRKADGSALLVGFLRDRILPGMMSGWMLPESVTAIINLHA